MIMQLNRVFANTFSGAFFFPQQIAQVYWLYKLWKGDVAKEDLDEMVDYVPFYTLGNVCIGSE